MPDVIIVGGGPVGLLDALREVLAETLELPDAHRHFTAMVDGTDVNYTAGTENSLVGRFMPQLEKPIDTGRPVAAAEADQREAPGKTHPLDGIMQDGRGLLLNFTDTSGGDTLTGYGDRVREVTSDSPDGSTALLVRPDGYIAWASGRNTFTEQLTTWFGKPPR